MTVPVHSRLTGTGELRPSPAEQQLHQKGSYDKTLYRRVRWFPTKVLSTMILRSCELFPISLARPDRRMKVCILLAVMMATLTQFEFWSNHWYIGHEAVAPLSHSLNHSKGNESLYIGQVEGAPLSHSLNHLKGNESLSLRVGNKPKVHFRTYGDEKYVKSKQRICQEANDTGWFDTVLAHGPEDCRLRL